MLVAAPTGAGKTIVGEFAVFLALQHRPQVLLHHPDQGAVATRSTPTWCDRHGAGNVGLLTGDTSINSRGAQSW